MSEAKSVFISGGTTGIGAATAQEFASRGWKVAIGYHKERPATLGTSLFVPLDLRDVASIKDAAETVLKTFGQIDVLVNNAGVLIAKPFLEQSDSEIEEQIAVNALGNILLTKAFIPHIRSAIVNVGSTLALHGKKRYSIYSASKFALRGFTQSLAKEYPKLLVYIVHPNSTATAMADFKGEPPEVPARIICDAAEGKLGSPSGGDIFVRHYCRGPRFAPFFRAYDNLKAMIRLAR